MSEISYKTEVPRWRWAIHLAAMLMVVLPSIIFAVQIQHRHALVSNATRLSIASARHLLLFGILFGFAWLASRVSRTELFLRWRTDLWVLPLGVAYSIGMRIAAALILTIIFGIFFLLGIIDRNSIHNLMREDRSGIARAVDVHALQNDPAYFWINMTLVSFLVAGFCEELWRASMLAGMRKLWPRMFGDTSGEFIAVAMIAVVFGAAHLPMGLFAAANAIIVGLALGVTMVVHRSIWPAVLAHGLFDATSLMFITYSAKFFGPA